MFQSLLVFLQRFEILAEIDASRPSLTIGLVLRRLNGARSLILRD